MQQHVSLMPSSSDGDELLSSSIARLNQSRLETAASQYPPRMASYASAPCCSSSSHASDTKLPKFSSAPVISHEDELTKALMLVLRETSVSHICDAVAAATHALLPGWATRVHVLLLSHPMVASTQASTLQY